ncbi:U3 small nucleolar RNA-associated protein 4-like protein [Camelus dromedarius]|uniref:U3 small nucleolar RNA-associated protein 4-like protein n=1 Tax=Camelus dromedarius TaxID=9838 RepID=A0A5N4DRR9_CAMDR|nr:U3 small nucleolar RNA-associated protein 4-like protein [Camelus dromedarius]
MLAAGEEGIVDSPGMGEFKVHRVRFFNYVPSGIRCVAYNDQSNRLAVSRTDGTVEIYNLSANYFQEKFFSGHESRATEALCWAKGQRLFSAGLNGEIIEYDLQALNIKYAMDAFGGPIWSMAASPSGSQLLVGCEDGSVKLFQVTPEKIQFERNFDRQKSRILSLSWHPSGTHVAAGSIDYISVFDVKSENWLMDSFGDETDFNLLGSAIHKMLVDRQYMGVSKRKCIIWGVAFLSDGTVISVDSAGKVQFWDSATGTLVKNHLIANADVQSIAVSDQEDSFVVGTAEGTVFHFQLVSVTSNSSEKQWVRTKPFQHHTHDVRAVAHSPTALISGGTDTHLVIRPLMEKVEVKNYDAALRKITFPHRRLVSCAKKRQLLLFQFAHHLELWRLGSTVATGKNGDTLPLSKDADHLLHLKAKVSKMPAFLRSALQILFSEDSTKLFVASNQGSLHVIRLLEGSFKHLHTFQPQSGERLLLTGHGREFSLTDVPFFPNETSVVGGTVESMCLLAVSPDGNWLAASGTSAGVHVYSVKHLKLHCTVPAYNFPVTALAIAPNTNNLVIAHSDQQVFEYSIPDKQYTEWSRTIQKQGFHHLWLQRDTPITHISFHPKRPMHILLHDAYMFCIIDKSLPLPNDKTLLYNPLPPTNESDVIRRRTAHAFKISKIYKPLLFMELLDERTLVAVERPLDDIIAQLPPPIKKKKFGT